MEQPRRTESPRERAFLLESRGSFGYDRGLKSDNWEMPVDSGSVPC